jgi:hypothetical protein
VAQTGCRSHLVGIAQDDHKGKIEQVYSCKSAEPQIQYSTYEFGAIFTRQDQAVLFGTVDGCLLVWDKRRGDVIYGFDHGKGTGDSCVRSVMCSLSL